MLPPRRVVVDSARSVCELGDAQVAGLPDLICIFSGYNSHHIDILATYQSDAE
jgi:hypothetical protein